MAGGRGGSVGSTLGGVGGDARNGTSAGSGFPTSIFGTGGGGGAAGGGAGGDGGPGTGIDFGNGPTITPGRPGGINAGFPGLSADGLEGAGGGAGGAHGSITIVGGTAVYTAATNGGFGGNAFFAGGAGGGAEGGYGLVVSAPSSLAPDFDIAGGKGGLGGSGTSGGGGGGDGGIGIYFTAADGSILDNSNAISGGAGGDGGASVIPQSNRQGDGGRGGNGIQGSGVTITNTGQITGGQGGDARTVSDDPAIAGPGQIGAGGTGVIGSDLTILNSGAISGGFDGSGFVRADALDFTAGTNTLTLSGAWTLLGNIHIAAATLLDFAQDEDATLSGTTEIHGDGAVRKSGSGMLTLSGIHTYADKTTIDGGTLRVDGSIISDTTVNTGGVLSGSGSLGDVTAHSGGHVAPGSSPGLMTTLNIDLQTGSTLDIELAGISYDQVRVNGSVALAGVLSIILFGGFLPATGNSFTIVDNDSSPNGIDDNGNGTTDEAGELDPVVGAFATLGEGATFVRDGVTYSITYHGGDGNDVVLTVLNGAPTVAQPLADRVSEVNKPVGIAVPAGTFADIEALTLTASLANGDPLPGTLTFDGTTITGAPPQNFVGDIEIAIKASDGTLATTDTFTLTVSNAGNDVLVSGTGTGSTGVGDIFPLVGGPGDDVYGVADETAEVTEDSGGGTDTVYASVTYTMADNVEGMVLQETGGAIDGTGSSGNDTIIGNSFANTLNGGDGIDALAGGGGNDVLIGGANVDGMAGGLGDDTYVVDDAFDQIQENPGEGVDTVYAGATFALFANIEGLVLLEGAGAIDGSGTDDNDTLVGNSSNNILNGRGGSDALIGGGGSDVLIGGADVDGMAGGLGDDTYGVDSSGDQIQENAGEGTDTVYASADFTLFDNLEGLVLVNGAGAIDGSGNGEDNYLFGNESANTLHGLGGHDVLFGGAGMDTLAGDGGNDVLTGGADNDLFWFDSGFGRDSIEDFAAGDHVVFSLAVFANFAAVQAHMSEMDATTTVIVLDNDNALAVHHASGAVLTQNDFMFV